MFFISFNRYFNAVFAIPLMTIKLKIKNVTLIRILDDERLAG